MEILLAVWEFFQNNILTKPQFFIGFIIGQVARDVACH